MVEEWGARVSLSFRLGVYGSFTTDEETFEGVIRSSSAELMVHGNTEDFPRRDIDWDWGFGR